MKARNFLFASVVFLFAGRAAPAVSSEAESAAVVSHIPRAAVQSSALARVGFSKRRHILEIQFTNGSVYRYYDVPPSRYRDLCAAASKGGYYATQIKKSYRFARVRPRIKVSPAN
jgi:hypothetical protein